MRIQHKVLVSILLPFCIFIGIVYILSNYIFLESFVQLEKSQIEKNIDRIKNSISTEISDLVAFTYDWAAWDDSYEFILSGEQNYIDANLVDSTFEGSSLDFIVYINKQGEVIYGREYDYVNGKQILLSNAYLELFGPESILLKPQTVDQAIGGIIRINKELYIVSSHPILDSNIDSDSRGVLLMGKKLADRILERLTKTTQVSIKLHDFDTLNFEEKLITQEIISSSKEKIVYESEEKTNAYILLQDIWGMPAVIIEAQNKRGIYQKGLQATSYMVTILIISTVSIALMLMFIIQKIVTVRVAKLENSVHQVELTGDISRRIENEISNDEIGSLAGRVNSMLESIQISQAQLETARLDAEQANLAKSEFLTSMSHELRTPLNAILGYSQLLDLRANNLIETEKEWVTEIIVAGKYLLNLISELLDLSNIESGQFKIDNEPLVISEVIEKAVSMIHPVANNAGVELVVEIGELQSLRITGDELRLQQILINLLTNALKYNKANGRVNLSGAIIGKYCYIKVEDNGIGISKEKLEDVFKPFQRGDAYDSGVDGVGIGLSITRRLVEAMNGRVEVKSKQNVGSIFTIVLPLS